MFTTQMFTPEMYYHTTKVPYLTGSRLHILLHAHAANVIISGRARTEAFSFLQSL